MNSRFLFSVFRFLFFAVGIILPSLLFAQDNKPAMADVMRENGKIYVVVAVCLTILIGLYFYVFLLDKKISRMEKNKEQ